MNKLVMWIPRVLSILLILLLLLLSFDVFFDGATLWEMLGGFIMHNVPTIIFGVVLYISWRRPAFGGAVFIFASFFYLFVMRNSEDGFVDSFLNSLMLAGPVFIVGVLYLVDWKINKRG